MARRLLYPMAQLVNLNTHICEGRRCAMEKMKSIVKHATHCLKSERGVTTMEYALVAGLISIVAIVAMGDVGTAVNAKFLLIQAAL